MGREFEQLFDRWALTYDETVMGKDKEYEEVFTHYEMILDEVAKRAVGTVLEFGVGTGNLTKKLLQLNHKVYGIEPSKEMRTLAIKKLSYTNIFDGDFLMFPSIGERFNSIVSSYAFHHLTDKEKEDAISNYANMLKPNEKIVFADTIFETETAKIEMVKQAEKQGYVNLAKDLQNEYYTTIPFLWKVFTKNGFAVKFIKMNSFVWILDAQKQ